MYERMLNAASRPADEELFAWCAEAETLLRELDRFLCDELKTQRELRFPYGNSYGWCFTYRKKKKLICDVFAQRGAFHLMLRLPDTAFQAVYPQLSAYTQTQIDNRYPCGSGGWLQERVTTGEQLAEMKVLLALK